MNLLTEDWIPVELDNERTRISLETLLTTDDDWKLTSFRDDMELATIQLLVSLVQVCFMPKDKAELIRRLDKPLTLQEYQKGIESFVEWFDLVHEKWPFMQAPQKEVGIWGDEIPIQKLYLGLPEGNNHCFFNNVGEVTGVHFGDAAVMLYNLALNAPGFSGKQKAGLRGGPSFITLVSGKDIRKTIWLNQITDEYYQKHFFKPNGENDFTWVKPLIKYTEIERYIKATKSKVNASKRLKIIEQNIGFNRQLFWQPILINLIIKGQTVKGFRMVSDFYYEFEEFILFPDTPWRLTKQGKPYYPPYSSEVPFWKNLQGFLFQERTEKIIGRSPASVVLQYSEYFRGKDISIIVGGYENNQANIVGRSHETFSMAEKWEEKASEIQEFVSLGNRFEEILRSALEKCCKVAIPTDKKNRYYKKQYAFAQADFFKNSEPVFHLILKQNDWTDLERFAGQLKKLTISIYEDTTEALKADVKYFRGIAEGRRLLHSKIKEIVG